MEEHLLTCSFKSSFGMECLGCGTQRSILALLRGDILESFLLNPGVLLILFTVIIGIFAIHKRSKHIYHIFVTGVSLTAIGMIARLSYHLIY